MKVALKGSQLKKKYGPIEMLKGIKFHVDEGEIFGILGANSAGKTTILECIKGMKSYSSESIEVFGKDISRAKDVQNIIGVQLQSSSL